MMTDAQKIQSLIDACDPDQLRRLVFDYGYDGEEITPELLNEIYLDDPSFSHEFANIVPKLNLASGVEAPFYDLNGNPVYDLSSYNTPTSSSGKTKWTASDINDSLKISTGFLATVLGVIKPDKYKYDAQAAMAMSERERLLYERELAKNQKNAMPWVWIVIGLFVVVVAALYFSNRGK